MRLLRLSLTLTLTLLTVILSAEPSNYRFYVYNAANGLADNSAQTINCTKTGRLVITTMGQINFFDGQRFTFIDPTTENTYPLTKYNGHAHLYFDNHHHLWLKKRHSLTCVNLTREQFVENIKDEFEAFGMTDQVEDLFVDDANHVWLLTGKGLYSVESQKFYGVNTKLVLQDLQTYKDQYLLLFYDNGQLDVLELSTGDVAYSENAYDQKMAAKYGSTSLAKPVGNIFYQIRNGNSHGVLLRFDIDKWKWDTILETPYYMSSIVPHDSLIFIPTAYGYWTYNPATGEKLHTEEIQMADGQMLLTDMNAMEFDRQGGLWIGTEKRGLLYARPFAAPFIAHTWKEKVSLDLALQMDREVTVRDTYRDKAANCVFRDSRGWDWVGTTTGLQLYRNSSVNLPQLFTRNDGLLNNVIHCVIEDRLHNIWVGTSYGVCCLVIRDDKVCYINRYNQWDGVPNESFVNGRSMMLPDGTIVMQALEHVLTFNPEEMHTLNDSVRFDIYPKLVRLMVNGNEVGTGDRLGGRVILERALTRTKEINLNYDQNSISLAFSGLNYFRPQQTYYRVRLKGPGMSDSWHVYSPHDANGQVDLNGVLHLPLISLQPGSYSIEVQTSMLPDQWSTEPYEWLINVNEPWWRTTGTLALLGLVLLVLLGVYLYLFLRNASLKARRNNEEQGILKRIRSFAERCDVKGGLVLEPSAVEIDNSSLVAMSEFSPEFIDTMIRIMPVVLGKVPTRLSMRELSAAAGMNLKDFYGLITSNIYKNPRPIALRIQLDVASRLLLEDKERDLAEIAAECGFITPNYFIASFFHKFGKTPAEYRREGA